jgi:hypothetical protein
MMQQEADLVARAPQAEWALRSGQRASPPDRGRPCGAGARWSNVGCMFACTMRDCRAAAWVYAVHVGGPTGAALEQAAAACGPRWWPGVGPSFVIILP